MCPKYRTSKSYVSDLTWMDECYRYICRTKPISVFIDTVNSTCIIWLHLRLRYLFPTKHLWSVTCISFLLWFWSPFNFLFLVSCLEVWLVITVALCCRMMVECISRFSGQADRCLSYKKQKKINLNSLVTKWTKNYNALKPQKTNDCDLNIILKR